MAVRDYKIRQILEIEMYHGFAMHYSSKGEAVPICTAILLNGVMLAKLGPAAVLEADALI